MTIGITTTIGIATMMMINGLDPYFCDGKSPKAQKWYESRTKAQLGELISELMCRLIEMKQGGEYELAQFGDDKHYGRWIRYIDEIEMELVDLKIYCLTYDEGLDRSYKDNCKRDDYDD